MLGAQVFNGIVGNAASVYGPVITRELGVAAQSVGVFFAVLFGTALVSGFLLVGSIQRYGAVRVLQAVTFGHVIGCAVAAIGTATAALAGALSIGVAAGLSLSSSSHIIARVTPRDRLGVIFSIKQTAAPIAVALVGLLIPALLLVLRWETSLLLLAPAGIVMILLLQVVRPALDDDRRPAAPLRGAGVLAPIRLLGVNRRLRTNAMLTLVLSAAQIALLGYIVTYLNLELGFTLVAAGLALSVSQFCSVFARIAWGWLADRLANPLWVMAVICVGSGIAGLVIAALRPAWGIAAVVAIVVAYSVFTMGWNGVFLAAVTRHAPPDQVTTAMIGMQLFSYAGMLGGPLLFAGVVSLSGSYSAAFGGFAVICVLAGAALLRATRDAGRSAEAAG